MALNTVSRMIMAAVLATGLSVTAAPAAQSAQPAPSAQGARVSVIVTLAPGAKASSVAAELAGRLGGRVDHVYSHAINGFSASLPKALLATLAADSRVRSVELDAMMYASATQSPTPSWGLDRIDQRNLPLNSSYTYNSTGAGVRAYVIDTGIQFSHPNFGGRAVTGFDAIDGGSADDCHGHGTHVAGTVGSTTYGVAKGVQLIGVRVLNCQGSGTNAQVVAGIDWVVANHQAGQPAVANMSLGGSANTAVDAAVRRMVADGISVSVAAGNENTNACNRSPARVAEAITVGASDINDARASFSNVGTCVDYFAPGVNITSTWTSGGTNTISGTSMASPHSAGVAAQYLQANPSASPSAVASALSAATTKNKITGTAGGCTLFVFCTPATPNNHLLFSSF